MTLRSLDRVVAICDRLIPKSWTPNGVSRFRMWRAAPIAMITRHLECQIANAFEGTQIYFFELYWLYLYAPVTVMVCIAACVSDALDGYLARTRGHPNDEEKRVGKRIDEVADKWFVYTYLPIVLVVPTILYGGTEWLWWALCAIGITFVRDVDISWRRSTNRLPSGLPVQTTAKWKTGLMMVGIIALTPHWWPANVLGCALCAGALVCALHSWYGYMRAARSV